MMPKNFPHMTYDKLPTYDGVDPSCSFSISPKCHKTPMRILFRYPRLIPPILLMVDSHIPDSIDDEPSACKILVGGNPDERASSLAR